VAVRVVDHLEVVDVEHAQRDQPVLLGRVDRVGQLLDQHGPVGQPGQRVVQRRVPEARLAGVQRLDRLVAGGQRGPADLLLGVESAVAQGAGVGDGELGQQGPHPLPGRHRHLVGDLVAQHPDGAAERLGRGDVGRHQLLGHPVAGLGAERLPLAGLDQLGQLRGQQLGELAAGQRDVAGAGDRARPVGGEGRQVRPLGRPVVRCCCRLGHRHALTATPP
jgi:hypothetical protein